MEFNDKLCTLRQQKGLTQEELASALFVSRTAVSKWESGRGYPSIDSLLAIAKFFDTSLDSLLSTEEVFTIAEENGKRRTARLRDLIFALLDISAALLLFLPFFAERVNFGRVTSASLLSLIGISPYLRVTFSVLIFLSVAVGILNLALAVVELPLWNKNKCIISLSLNAAAALLFIVSLHPYAAAFSFVILLIKLAVFIKNH